MEISIETKLQNIETATDGRLDTKIESGDENPMCDKTSLPQDMDCE